MAFEDLKKCQFLDSNKGNATMVVMWRSNERLDRSDAICKMAIMEEEHVLTLPTPKSSEWVVQKVMEMRRRMGISFKRLDDKVENLLGRWREDEVGT